MKEKHALQAEMVAPAVQPTFAEAVALRAAQIRYPNPDFANFTAQHRANLSRRAFLRGAGVCLALPALESLLPRQALADLAEGAGRTGRLATTGSGAPLRTAFVYFPNGAIQPHWWPAGTGADFKFNATLQPLEAVRESVRVLGGLDHACADPGPDGAGDHARANAVFLSGVRPKKSATDIHLGISIDQVMARAVGHLTRLPSLELTCDDTRRSSACDSDYACAYQYNISWSSPTTPVAAEGNPRLAFERLFGTGAPGERVENSKRRLLAQKSVLDFVMEDARSMQRRLGAGDKAKLDQYLTGVREIEARIQKAETFGAAPDPRAETPSGVPTDQAEYVGIMFDLLLMAFQTDSTRIASFCLAHDGDNRSFSHIGIPEGHHDLSHHQNDPDRIAKVAKIDLWYVQQFAQFLAKLRDTRDVDGNSLLHNSMIVYGSGDADGNRHTHENLPILLAGHGGGALAPSGYVNYKSTPACNLFLSLADRMGMQNLERFGDSTGRVSI
ncbi:MAG TPA: DUF1552 domain-containing protein [Chthonomonadaceae bacterium]|nr:DUF1552 domain-containing protein [Chthonomonadaceae bacterium]